VSDKRDRDVEIIDADSREIDSRPDDEPPVVARLIVEIRSDGSRTIARGAMEDIESGQKVAVEARGDSPFSLAMSLAKAMVKGPSFARSAARALLPGRRKKTRK